jgi:multiple sugar transport system permease protein
VTTTGSPTSGSTAVRPPEAAPEHKPRGVRDNPASVGVAMVVLIAMTMYFVLPVFWLVVASTKSQGDLIRTFGFWFSDPQLGSNISALFAEEDGVYTRWLLNSLLYAGVGALVGTVLAAMAGYGLSKYAFRGREVLFSVILGGVLMPATALALPLFLLFSEIGQTDTYWSVFLPSIVSPFGVYLSRVYAAGSVPDELIEAARIDGAGELRIFFTQAVRLMSPALVTIYLFQFVTIWNNFFLPLIMLQDSKLFPVTLGLFTWNSQTSRNPELLTLTVVGSLVSVIPLILLFLSLQRYWRTGLASGSVK